MTTETVINLPTGLGGWRSQRSALARSPPSRRPSLRKGWLPAARVWPPRCFCFWHWGSRPCYGWRNQIQPCLLRPSPCPPPSPTAHHVPRPEGEDGRARSSATRSPGSSESWSRPLTADCSVTPSVMRSGSRISRPRMLTPPAPASQGCRELQSDLRERLAASPLVISETPWNSPGVINLSLGRTYHFKSPESNQQQ